MLIAISIAITPLSGVAAAQVKALEAARIADSPVNGSTAVATPILQPSAESEHFFTEDELIASIPPDIHHKYPQFLSSLITSENGRFLVTIHQGQDRGDRLALWMQVGENNYRLAQLIQANDEGESIDVPTVFRPRGAAATGFLHVVCQKRNTEDEFVFAFNDSGELSPVEIDPPPKEYQSMLRPGETMTDPANIFVDNEPPRFEIGITRDDDPPWHPSAGVIDGDYKIEKIAPSGWRGDTRAPIVWRFVPENAVRRPPPD